VSEDRSSTGDAPLVVEVHHPRTPDGWTLHLKRTFSPEHLDPAGRPVLIVPGYGMNSFIFGFHPRGTSMERCLAEAGLEVWSANLRGQGRSAPTGWRAPPPSLRSYSELDVHATVEHVLCATRTVADRVDLVGASLGGSIAYAHLALRGDHRVAGLVAIGAPLRWTEVPAVLRLPFRSARLAGMVRVSGVRRMARLALPVVGRVPSLLSMYLNADHIDLKAVPEMVQTIEDPHPRVNRDIAHWIGARDMVLRGVNVTEALGAVELPLLVMFASRDGIVPESAARAATEAWGGTDVQTLCVGAGDDWYAHADLFVGHDAPRLVFEPIVRWLRDRW